MKINEVEQLTGVPKKSIRFYEEQGLLTPERNRENGYRVYTEEHVVELKRIKLMRKLSVPIEDIRQLQQGLLTVNDVMNRQLILLQRESENLKERADMCSFILTQKETVLEELGPDRYLEQIGTLEKKGVSFMKPELSMSRKQYVAPVLATTLMGVLMLALMALFYWAYQYDDMPFGVLIACCLVVLGVAIGVVIALVLRIKEISGGEEYDARKY